MTIVQKAGYFTIHQSNGVEIYFASETKKGFP